MPIAKSAITSKTRNQIQDWLKTRQKNDYLKQDCGKLLFNLARSYGYDAANALVIELKLDELLDIPLVCPVQPKSVQE